MQNYKADRPENTIKRIRDILSRYGIETECITFGKEGVSYSARVSVKISDSHLNIGTNGKGLTKEYAVASAYGELMERLCNKALTFVTKYSSRQFLEKNRELEYLKHNSLDFRYFPDEYYETISAEKLHRCMAELMPNYSFPADWASEEKFDMPFIPFRDYFRNKVQSLPYDLIRLAAGSTGLCAGNTIEEAILQGINEIFERYVLQRIYIDQPSLPTISLDRFENTCIGERIRILEEHTRWRFIVKDCSLGKGFPVIGLMIIDDANGKFTFRLGADLSDEIALQRCFTEIFQGNNVDNSSFLPISVPEKINAKQEYENNVINGRGYYPETIFIEDNHAYDCSLKPLSGNSIENSLSNVLDWLKIRKYDLYIRDNSFLGFPVYHLYIPGLSDVNNLLSDITPFLLNKDGYYEIKEEFRLKRVNVNEARMVIRKYRDDNRNSIALFNYSTSPYNIINRDLLLSMLSYFVENDKDAYDFMSEFLLYKEGKGQKQCSYYYCIRDMFILKHKTLDDDIIKKILGTIYTPTLANEVITDMKHRSEIMKNFPIPDCFNCSSCNMKKSCCYESIVKFESHIQDIQKMFAFTQDDLILTL